VTSTLNTILEPTPTQTQFMIPFTRQSPTVHLLHAVATLLTMGVWAPVWITYAITARRRRLIVTLQPSGPPTVELA